MRTAAIAALIAGSAWAAPVQAQSACERLKATLAARIDAAARGFVLEDVPADAPVPAGGKVIGNCEGGARKVLLLRGTARATTPSAAPSLTPAPTPPERVRAQAPPPVASAAASAPAPSREPVVSAPTAAPAPPAAPEPLPAEAAPLAEPAPTAASSPSTPTGLLRHWPWAAGAAGVLLLAWLAAWIAHRRAYDAAGLPRGPRLN